MSMLNYFDNEMITNVKITSKGDITGVDLNGQPIYDTDEIKYDSDGAVWQGSSSQVFTLDRVVDPGTYQIVLEPERITGTLSEGDTCEITINGVLRDFDLSIPNDILGLGEVMILTGTLQVFDG